MRNEAERAVVYTAAGGVVVDGELVLVLSRPARGEVRLPKGHVEAGESLETAALREVYEESGYKDLQVLASLGSQVVEYDHKHYFLMKPVTNGSEQLAQGEAQFKPMWLSWSDALGALSYDAEKEWVRRARSIALGLNNGAND